MQESRLLSPRAHYVDKHGRWHPDPLTISRSLRHILGVRRSGAPSDPSYCADVRAPTGIVDVVYLVPVGLMRGGDARGPSPRPGSSQATGSITQVSDDDTSRSAGEPLKVLVYSDDVNTRGDVILALGKRPHPDLPVVEYVEVATEPVVIEQMDSGRIDLAILDGEAVPVGGMGIAKQLKDEIFQCPPVLVLTGRPQDAWLATWSRAEAAVPQPIDPLQLADAVVRLLRGRVDMSSATR